jgi:hypothetical protein
MNFAKFQNLANDAILKEMQASEEGNEGEAQYQRNRLEWVMNLQKISMEIQQTMEAEGVDACHILQSVRHQLNLDAAVESFWLVED